MLQPETAIRRPTRHRAAGLFVPALILLVFALALPALAGAATPVTGGLLTFALQGDPASIEPLNADAAGMDGAQVCQALFWGLVRYRLQPDGTLATVPAVASSWDVNAAATVFTFHLRSDVTFAAPVSREVRAQDFVYAWNRATDPATNSGSWTSYVLAPIEGCDDAGSAPHGLSGVRALDDHTLQVTLRYPFADFPTALASLVAAPVPEEYVQSLGTTADARNKAFGEKPVGNGPYVLGSWTHGEQIVLVRNPSFWDAANVAKVAEIDLPIYAGAAGLERQWTDFQNGDLDFAALAQAQIPAAIAAYGRSSDGYTVTPGGQVLAGPYGNTNYIVFNCLKAPLDNVDVRRAFSLAVDRQAISDIQRPDEPWQLADDIIPPSVPGHLPGAWPYAHHDRAAAAARLATAGYPAGVGLPTITFLYSTGDPVQEAIADLVKTDLEAIGARVTLEAVDLATYINRKDSGEFMIARTGWFADYFSADNFLYPLFQSGQNKSDAFYSDATVDADLAAARAATAAGARLAYYQAADATVGEAAPIIPVNRAASIRVGAARLRSGVMPPDRRFGFEAVWLTDGDQPVPSITSLTSSTNKVSSRWYAVSTPAFSWVGSPTLAAAFAAPTVSGYSYLLDQNPFAFPPRPALTTATTFRAPSTADGVWYFHLRAVGDDGIWGPVSTYAVRIDTKPPTTSAPKACSVRRGAVAKLSFAVADPEPNGGWATVTIKTKDSRGRVVKSLKVGRSPVNEKLSTSFTCKLATGKYTFSVYARDAASNGQARVGSNRLTVK
jgi:peptide/nickel transport system substrate-binding protein/oligopeptide transport system substrate-binding protein